jgi:hypothetical protein
LYLTYEGLKQRLLLKGAMLPRVCILPWRE